MELFERIKYIISGSEFSQASVARRIGVVQQVFNQWLNPKSQKNLWEHLPVILEMFPDVRREWLYFGEGEMLQDAKEPHLAAPPSVPPPDVLVRLAELEQELREERRLNRQLTTRLLIDGTGDKDASENIVGKTANGQ